MDSVTASTALVSQEDLDRETRRTAEMVWRRLSRRKPSFLEPRWWEDRLLSVAMVDESIKVQMLRFVDVLPRLKSHEEITRHLQEYFDEIREHLPWAVELVRYGVEHVRPNSVLSRALAYNARLNALRMARRFIAGTTPPEILRSITDLRRQGYAFTLDLLGEAVISDVEAERYQAQYLKLLDELPPVVNAWPEAPQADCDHLGPIPRVNLSLKLSALVSHFRPVDATGTAKEVKERLRSLLRRAREQHAYLHVDMEQFEFRQLTETIFREVLMEDEFRDFADVGIVVQAYLRDAEEHLASLEQWARKRGTPVTVRLVKGAYWDYETVTAQARGWPIPVYQHKAESDACFERCTRFLMENYERLRPAIASHNLRSLSHAVAMARLLGVPREAFELQMLYGMGQDQAEAFLEDGYRVRVYAPFGEMIPGMSYLVRRLLENTSNDSFLRLSHDDAIRLEDLLMNPASAVAALPPQPAPVRPPFENEPLTDFSIPENRDRMQHALDEVEDQLGVDYGLIIDGKAITSRPWIVSRDPSRKAKTVGRVASANTDDALQAIDAARRASAGWARTEVQYRGEYLELVAKELRERRFELAAWEVFECGKPWIEADADIAEAIDFCMYYAWQMRQFDDPLNFDVPGEDNRYAYQPRGVAVVIAPWNFPLAILTGMTAAALVAGNTVIMKPAEQSSVIAAKFMEILQNAGIPDGVVNFLPGVGEEVGPVLVESPDVDVIAFTGSRNVGLSIYEQASRTHASQRSVKHVIAEMGGKNAIIVDSDADLDEAVSGVLYSAFGYAGQKCSACSRCIVLGDAYDEFLERLVEAARAYQVGPATEPGSLMGPVIDEEAYTRIRETLELEEGEGRIVFAGEPGPFAKKGYFIGPQIVADVPETGRLAREEIFGPVLAVFRVKDFPQALALANSTDYALTGGVYSRSPANLKRARLEFQVGNLYLNRPITGAIVGRQPFGGFRLSGIGTKAGGPDYLKQFLIPRHICENTLRRGFAPGGEEASSVS